MADIRRMTSVGARGTNPVLPAGVYGWERDTGVVKLGDGVTQWNNLGLAGIAPGAIPASVVLKIEAVTASEYATLPWVDPEIMYVIDDGRVLLGSKSLASSGLDQPADSDLTAIAALATTTYGRSLLTTADVDALATAIATRTAMSSRYLSFAGEAARDAALEPFRAQIAAGTTQVYILGHSVVNGSSATTAGQAWPSLFKRAVLAADPAATVTIAGHAGYTSTQLLALFAGAGQNASFTSMTIFMGLLNDHSNGIAPATTKSNLQGLVAAMKAVQPNNKPTPAFVLLVEWQRGDTFTESYPWSSYVAAAYEVAAADPSVVLIDVGARLPSPDADLSGIYAADHIHPNDYGHKLIARMVVDELLPDRFTTTSWQQQIIPWCGPANTIVGTWAPAVNTSTIGNGVYVNTSNAQNDAATWYVTLSPGNWTVDLVYNKNTNGAIATVELDDGFGTFSTVGTVDTYAASAAYNQVTSITGVSVVGAFPHRRQLRIKAATRNASNTTGWYLNLAAIQMRRY